MKLTYITGLLCGLTLSLSVCDSGAQPCRRTCRSGEQTDSRGCCNTTGQRRPSGALCSGGRILVGTACVCRRQNQTFNTTLRRCVSPPRDSNEQTAVSSMDHQCPGGMVRISAGSFVMGAETWTGTGHGPVNVDEGPPHSVTIPAFCMDRTEVTVSAYRACVEAGGCIPASRTVSHYEPDPTELWSQFCNEGRQDVDDHPVNCVSWTQSVRYCEWRDARLPTEAEWEYAARGSEGNIFPWGIAPPDRTLLNAAGAEFHDLMHNVGGHAYELMYPGNDGWAATAPVGNYPSGSSPFGLLDMAGNVREWVSDWYGRYHATIRSVNPAVGGRNHTGPRTGTTRVNRGGGWNDSLPDAVRAARRHNDDPSTQDYNLGFRCARSIR